MPRIVILGSGYVAIFLARQLRAAVRKGSIDLTIVDKNNYHTFHGLVPEMLTGKIQAGQIISPCRRLFAPARFVNAEVTSVDVANKRVQLTRIHDGQSAILEYDHLVVNLGSVDDLSRYRGLGEHTLRLKSYYDCIRVRNHILAMLEMAELEENPEERRRLLHFVIGGGNYAGVEVAAELSTFLQDETRRDFPRIDPKETRVTIVHGGPHILPELARGFPRLVDYAGSILRERGVQIEVGARLASATRTEVILSDGRRLPTRTIISCTGTAQHPVLDALPFERDKQGRLVTDCYGRVSEKDCVWSAGDCASLPMKNGQIAPPLAMYAMQGGKTIGRNLLRTFKGQKLTRYAFTGMGDCCVLGRRKAAGQLWGVPLKGFIAWLVWRGCMVAYLPLWAKRVRTVLDWITVPLFGRDIASVQTNEKIGVVRDLFEPGQTIIRQGDVGREMYIIQSGKVEVSSESPQGITALAQLGPGDYFGEIAVLEDVRRTATVRALEPVTLLRISREDTRLLTSSFRPFADFTTERTGRSTSAK